MYHDIDKFNELMAKVETNSPTLAKVSNNSSELDLSAYNMDPIHEGILQAGINKASNLLSANLKSKISNEWKHLDNEERRLLLRIIAGNNSAFADSGEIDVALASAFKDKTLSATKDEEGSAAIIVNKDVDLSNSGANRFPEVSIDEIKGDLKCNYSSFTSFVGFPRKVKSLEFVKGREQLENLVGIPEIYGRDEIDYSLEMKGTKINSLKGLKAGNPLKGHVSFRGCDLKDISVQGTVYISGSLDIRDNPNISVESLKALLLKDYSKNQIIVKGKIYHTLESDGYYSAKSIKSGEPSVDLLGPLTEAVSKQGTSISQEELWKIGPEIIKQAELKKSKKEKTTPQELLTNMIKPQVQNLVSDMASSQMDKNVVAQANQKVVSGMSSDEFRAMMKGLFDNLLKQLTAMMNNQAGGDTATVEKTVDTIAKATAENVADSIETYSATIDEMLNSEECMNFMKFRKIAQDLRELIKNVPQVGSAPLEELLKKASSLAQSSNISRDKYKVKLNEFFDYLYVNVLGKPKISDTVIEKAIKTCYGEEVAVEKPQASVAEDIPEVKDSSSTVAPEPPAPEPPPVLPSEPNAVAPAPETKPATAPAKAPANAPKAKAPSPTQVSKPTQGALKTSKTTPPLSTTALSDKETKGLDRFSKIISSAPAKAKGSEKSSEEK